MKWDAYLEYFQHLIVVEGFRRDSIRESISASLWLMSSPDNVRNSV
jgi:hypothetical protein